MYRMFRVYICRGRHAIYGKICLDINIIHAKTMMLFLVRACPFLLACPSACLLL